MSKSLTLSIYFVLFLFTPSSFASTQYLAWDAPKGNVTGYRIYFGTMMGRYDRYIDVGNVTTYPIDKLPFHFNTLYFIVVKAYNSAGESKPSNYVEWLRLGTNPNGIVEVLKVLLLSE